MIGDNAIYIHFHVVSCLNNNETVRVINGNGLAVIHDLHVFGGLIIYYYYGDDPRLKLLSKMVLLIPLLDELCQHGP